MKIAIVHLSDIHFKSSSDIGFRRREKLANTIAFSRSPEERLLLVVTGDIANTGSPDEYRVAEDFFRQLLIDLRMNAVATPSELTLIPGNHDCNFHELGDLRPRLLAEVAAQLDTIDDRGETVRTLLQVQTDFFSFQERITGESIPPENQLFFVKKLDLDGKTLELRCFNSAWLSSKHEETGSLGFPLSTVEAATAKTDSDIVISIVHHPSNWLSPSAYQGFRRAVQETSDFLFTGHEHTLGGQVIAPFGDRISSISKAVRINPATAALANSAYFILISTIEPGNMMISSGLRDRMLNSATELHRAFSIKLGALPRCR
jgi:hypothetical protein